MAAWKPMLSRLRAPLAVPAAGLLADILIGICLLVLGVAIGLDSCHRFVGTPQFYQSEFGPAVMVAAGRGFVALDLKSAPAVADFLFLRRPKLEPAEIPEDVRTVAPNQFHNATRYLEMTVGYWWRIVGISWSAVFAINAAFCGMSVAAYYAIFRLLLSRPLAVAGALFLCFSPIHLQYVPQLRDYSKAPFMLVAVALIAAPAIRPVGRRALVALAASCGLVLGLGMGFRMDMAVMVPIFGISLVVFHGDRPWHDVRVKGMALAAFVFMFTVASAPILIRLRSGGSNAIHVVLLGFGEPFDRALGIRGSLYTITPFYNDIYMSSTVQSYAERLHQLSPPLPSAGYDAMSTDYLLRIVRNFPADVFTRVLAAAKGIFDLPFRAGVPVVRGGALQAFVGKALEYLRRLDGYGPALGVFLVAAGAIRRPKLGLFVAFFVLALSSYPALQFDPRHFFHLQFIPILGLLLALNVALSFIATAWRCLRPGASPPLSPERMDRWRVAKRLALAVGVLAMTTVAPTVSLRIYQKRHLASLVGEYLVGPKRAVEPIFTETGSGGRIASWGGMAGREYLPGSTVLTDYYMVEFVGAPDSAVDAIGLRYRAASPYSDYSRIIAFSTREGVNRILFPVYGSTSVPFQFDGLDVSVLGPRLKAIYRLDDLTHRPLLLDLRLPAGWEKEDLFQTLRAEGKTSSPDVRLAEGSSISISTVSQISWIERLASPALRPRPGRVDVLSSNEVRVTRRAIEMDGRAARHSSFLVRFKPMAIAKGAMLLAQGRLEEGGLGIGFLKDGGGNGMVVVTQPGEFIAALEASEDGNYVPVIINATKRDGDRNRFVIRQFGFATTATALPKGPAPADPGRPTEDP
jgi:hypothetical protein